MTDPFPTVSVIVPVFNGEKSLPALIDSLRGQTFPGELVEMIFVDNNSTDRSYEVMRGYPDVIALKQTAVQGPAATRNVGIERATGEVLAFVDSDCVADRHWVRKGVEALVNQRVDRIAGYVEFMCSERPGIFEVYDFTMNFQQGDFVNKGWSGSGNLFVRHEVFQRIGGFNPELYSHEDSEWGLRATKEGFSLGYCRDAVVRHATRKTLKALVLKWIRTEYGAAQAWRHCELAELHLWYKKANWRPLFKVWRQFPEEHRRTWRRRAGITLIANILRIAGNFGNFLGYYSTGKWVLKG